MNEELQPGQERLLHDLWSGACLPTDERVVELLRTSPAAAKAHAEYTAMVERIDGATHEREQLLAEVLAQAPSADEERVVAGFRDFARGASPAAESAQATPALTRWAWLGALAAAVFLIVQLRPSPPAEDTSFTLGDNSSACGSPSGEVDAFGTFTWSLELPRNGSFELSVYDAANGALLHREEDWERASWTYDAASHGAWPDRIRWNVLVRDGGGSLTNTGCEAQARRR